MVKTHLLKSELKKFAIMLKKSDKNWNGGFSFAFAVIFIDADVDTIESPVADNDNCFVPGSVAVILK